MPPKLRPGRFAGLLLAFALAYAGAAASNAAEAERPLPVVAAENFYADVARQVAGPGAAVASILSNPDQDPHAFEASPSVARAFAASRIAVVNGAGYDPWATKLLAATKSAGRTTIVVADLL
ncbi:MAG: zinc ABC transporter substrate-binding protein, partial [Acetobacteraceae bacterium]|nr:zinc ABC transporter substrate-binding protein [Acetobacteraceae bacterium]